MKTRPERKNRRRIVLAILAVMVAEGAVMRMRGYRMGGRLIVRCREGHLFTTIWIPGGSLKAMRLGWWRFQYCPVGRHWSLVTPVKESDLTPKELRQARANRDIRLP